MNLIEAINHGRPEGWGHQEFTVAHNEKSLSTEVTLYIQFQQTDWVVIDPDGTIDAPLTLRADWEVSDEFLDDILNNSDVDDIAPHVARLLYAQVQLDITDLVLAGAGESQDPLLHYGEGKRFLPRDLAREMVKNLLSRDTIEKIHPNSQFTQEEWYKEWESKKTTKSSS